MPDVECAFSAPIFLYLVVFQQLFEVRLCLLTGTLVQAGGNTLVDRPVVFDVPQDTLLTDVGIVGFLVACSFPPFDACVA